MKTYLYGSIASSEIIRDVRARTYITDDGQVDVLQVDRVKLNKYLILPMQVQKQVH